MPVLDGVDLVVAPGEILTLVGPSGCGKSTLLRTLAGLLPPLAGEVSQDGRPLTGPAADRALVFQEDALLPWRTLRANVELPLAIKGLPRAERRRQAEAWLERVGLADHARHAAAPRLRRTAPARPAGPRPRRAPRAVLMDEPFGALDAQTRAGMQDLLVEVLRGTGATVVFVTHDVDEALFLGDRVALIGSGRLSRRTRRAAARADRVGARRPGAPGAAARRPPRSRYLKGPPVTTSVNPPLEIPALADAEELTCDVLVIGGGTAGTMAALTAAEHGADVILLEKAHVRHSGALAMGMDGVNNAVIPGRAEPDDYVAEITRANDGIVDQSTVRQTATRGFGMVQRLESYGVKFEKDEHGDYAVRQVHRSGSYVLPMPEGKDVKKVLYRQLRRREMRERIRIENRVMPVRVLTSPEDGRAVGAVGFNTRTGRSSRSARAR